MPGATTTTTSTPPAVATTAVATRGVVQHEGKLLLVTHGEGYWYAPGGRMEPTETLPACLAREVHEETGLRVQVADLLAVSEYLDPSGEHKIECFFAATALGGPGATGLGTAEPWHDTGGPVTSFGWFDQDELAEMDVRPDFLRTLRPGTTPASTSVYIPPQ